MKNMSLAEKIKLKAADLGFDLAAITDASSISPEHINYFSNWLDAGFAAEMAYMHRNFEKRTDPQKLFTPARSIIVVGLNYKPDNATQKTTDQPTGQISDYALYPDYHDFIKHRLRKLAVYINTFVDDLKFKICVDSVPLAERALAARAGLGFIGKNHMLINPTLGCQIFLGELLINIDLPCDKPLQQTCDNCDLCIKACPTGALTPTSFDASKCISYLTIEHKGQIHTSLAEKFAASLFGCDRCSKACPNQQKAPACKNKDFSPILEKNIDLDTILNMTEEKFANDFKTSSLSRTTLQSLKRNARICKNNYLSSS